MPGNSAGNNSHFAVQAQPARRQTSLTQANRKIMLNYLQAQQIIAANSELLPTRQLRPVDACGYISAEQLVCTTTVPPFNNSAMDGYAVFASDTQQASNTNPLQLAVTGTVIAGEAGNDQPAKQGTAWEIMTGAALPAGYDGVIPIEQVEVQRNPDGKPTAITLKQPVAKGRNLRRAGEDFQVGSPLLSAGQLIGANQIMGLSAAGVTSINVRAKPRLAAITTGNELSDDRSALSPGMIYDANGPYLHAAIPTHGAENLGIYRSSDSADELLQQIAKLQPDVDMILTTGGVSAGRMDFVPAALEQMGADILFHRVAIRPGKPLLFAVLPDGTRVFSLPGNPIAVAVGLRFFVVPALRRMQGLPEESYLAAKLKEPLGKKPGLRFFAKARTSMDDSGHLEVTVLPGQESFKISPLMESNCWVIVAEDCEEIPAGATVSIAPTIPGNII